MKFLIVEDDFTSRLLLQKILSPFNEQCDAYLVKPVDKAKLLGQLREFGLIYEGVA